MKTNNQHIDNKTEVDDLLRAIGPVIRETMAQAIALIQKETATFIATPKVGYDGLDNDLVTNVDRAAQEFYVNRFAQAFPGVGLLGEEDGLKKPCTIEGENIYITIDPLDGTKAFARQQSHGVGTMVAVVRNGAVIAAYVGDINTGEIYGYAPDAPAPTRQRFGVLTALDPKPQLGLEKRYILLNAIPEKFPENIRKFAGRPIDGGLFKDIEVMYGSYGAFCARLWKGEVAAIVLDPAFTTPWDETPILGIMEALGFIRIKVDMDGNCEVFEQEPPTTVYKIPFNIVVVHHTQLDVAMRNLKGV